MDLVGKAAAEFEKIEAHFGRSFTWVKCYQTALPSPETLFVRVDQGRGSIVRVNRGRVNQ